MRRLVLTMLLLPALVFAQTGEKKEMPAEKKDMPAAPLTKTAIVGTIAVKTIPAMTAATVFEKAADFVPTEGFKPGMEGAVQAWGMMMPDAYKKLGDWMAAGGKPMGPSFAIYYEDPTKTEPKDLTAKVGFPTMKKAKGTDAVKIEEFPKTKAAVVRFSGPYSGSGEVYGALHTWIAEHGYEMAGPPMEIYLKSDHDKVPADKYLTEIQFPVKKVEKGKPGADKTKVGEAHKGHGDHKVADAPQPTDAPKAAEPAAPPSDKK